MSYYQIVLSSEKIASISSMTFNSENLFISWVMINCDKWYLPWLICCLRVSRFSCYLLRITSLARQVEGCGRRAWRRSALARTACAWLLLLARRAIRSPRRGPRAPGRSLARLSASRRGVASALSRLLAGVAPHARRTARSPGWHRALANKPHDSWGGAARSLATRSSRPSRAARSLGWYRALVGTGPLAHLAACSLAVRSPGRVWALAEGHSCLFNRLLTPFHAFNRTGVVPSSKFEKYE